MRSTVLLSFPLLLPGSPTARETYCDVGPCGKTGKSTPLVIPRSLTDTAFPPRRMCALSSLYWDITATHPAKQGPLHGYVSRAKTCPVNAQFSHPCP